MLGARVGGVRPCSSALLSECRTAFFGTEALVVQPIDFVRHAAAAEETLHNRAEVNAAKLSRQEPPRGPGSTSTRISESAEPHRRAAAAPRSLQLLSSWTQTPAAALPENAQNRDKE